MHLADIHLGMENYGRVDSKSGLNSRLLDFLRSFDQAVDYALNNAVDLVVFAGDAYKTRDPNPTQQREFARRIKRLSDGGIPTVLLVGNHDLPNNEGKAHSLEIFRTLGVDKVFVARRPEVLTIETKHGRVQVACLPYLSRSSLLSKEEFKGLSLEELDAKMAELLTMFIGRLARDLDSSLPSIFTAHITVANALLGSEKSIMVGKDVVIPLSSVALPEFDYVALGHVHKHQVLAESPWVVYAGSLDRIDFGEEKEAKGFCLVNLAKGSTTMQFKPIETRELLSLDLFPKDPDPTDEVLTVLSSRDLSRAVVKLNLNLTQEQAALIRLDEVHKYLGREAYLLAGIHRQTVKSPAAGRSPGLTAQSGPLDALEAYLQLQPQLATKAQRLKQLAADLIGELQGEELG